MRAEKFAAALAALFMTASASGQGKSPVLVELFTSQGCSSCPPAEDVFSTWGREAFERGEIVPLAFHVDYWDKLGWKDPFSSGEYTRRQRLYAAAFREDTIYTPQIVVAGETGFVGSDRRRAEREAAKAGEGLAPAEIDLGAAWRGEKLSVNVVVRPAGEPAEGNYRVTLAVFENGLTTDVRRGENAGRTMRGEFVVRELKDLGLYEPVSRKPFRATAELDAAPAWARANVGVAVFLQDAEGRRVTAARALFPIK